jgi:hypothetical protein
MTATADDFPVSPAVPPRVSVLVATFDGAAFIAETLRSILDQDLKDLEVLVVDDGSTDGTIELVRGFGDSRVRLLSTPRNLGPAGARNFGFAQCRGRYVAPVDQDDIVLPYRLARQVAYLDVHDDTVLVATATERLVGTARVASPEPARTSPGFLRWALLVGNPLVWSSVLIRKSAVDALGMFNNEARRYAEDFDLYHRLAAVGSIARIDEVMTLYRSHAAGASQTFGDAMQASAARVLADAYAPLLGSGARRSAQIVARHVGAGEPVPDIETLKLIEAVLQATTRFVRARHAADEVARGLIATERSVLMQRLARAALRTGSVSALALRRAGLPLPPRGVLGDSVVGVARRLRRKRGAPVILAPGAVLPASR